jgi:hypothetical protein
MREVETLERREEEGKEVSIIRYDNGKYNIKITPKNKSKLKDTDFSYVSSHPMSKEDVYKRFNEEMKN